MRSCLAIAILAAALLGTAEAAPSAARVILRSKARLDDALRAAVGTAESVLLVVDVTPYTAAEEGTLRRALVALEESGTPAASWRIGPLGGDLGAAVDSPSGLLAFLHGIFARPSETGSTLPALRRTLASGAAAAARVVYLADWHFEDDEGLEEFIAWLHRRSLVLSVVGSEAAYGRGWNDGFFPPDRGTPDGRGGTRLYDPSVGRNPFGDARAAAPPHSGDSAWTHLPFRFRSPWQTVFPASPVRPPPGVEEARRRYARDRRETRAREGDLEDSRERLAPGAVDPDALRIHHFPLPSAFGPYGLMRAAAETGGRYILWCWNRAGRSDVTYDYSRCDLFAPDLRPRDEIRVEASRRPLARALLQAWHAVANDAVAVAAVTPPLARDLLAPLPMEEAGAPGFGYSWPTRADHRRFLAGALQAVEAIQAAVAILDRGLAAAGDDAQDHRYRADARLFRHALLVSQFELNEGLAAAEGLPRDAWADPRLLPGLLPEWWLPPQGEPGAFPVHHAAEADSVAEDRSRHLARYHDTPAGEIVRRNGVLTYRLHWSPVADGRRSRENPAASSGRPPPATPPGASSGRWATTGG